MPTLPEKNNSGTIRSLEEELKILKAENERYKSFFYTVDVAVLTFKDNEIIDWNSEALKLLERSASDLKGVTLPQISPEFQPDDQKSSEKAAEIFKYCRRSKKMTFEWRFQLANGTSLETEITLQCERTEGAVIFHASIYDLTNIRVNQRNLKKKNREIRTLHEERESLNEELRTTIDEVVEINKQLAESEKWNKTIVQNIPLGLIVVRHNIFEYVNDKLCDILELKPEDIQKLKVSDIVVPEERKKAQEHFNRLANNEPLEDQEYWIETKTGQKKYLKISFVRLGRDSQWMILVSDFTKLKQHETDLAQSEERLKFALAATNTGIWDIDLSNSKTVYSENWSSMLGFSPEELDVSREIWKRMAHPNDVAKLIRELDKHMRGETPYYESEYRVKTKQGEWKWLLTRGKLFSSSYSSSPSRFIGVHFDIDNRKKMELQIQESEARFRLLAENSTDMICRHAPDGTFIYISPACRNLLGYFPEELIGKKTFDFAFPDDVAAVRNSLNYVTSNLDAHTIIYRFRKKDGTFLWFETTSKSIHDPETDEVIEIHSASRDVTERELIEQKLRRSEERFRAIVQQLSDLIWIIDANMTVKYESPSVSRILGYDPNFFLGKNGFEYVHPDDSELVLTELSKIMNKDYDYKPTELRFRHFDKHWVYVEVIAENLIDHHSINGILITARDITERKVNEDKLKKYQNHLEQLVRERTERIEQINAELMAINQELSATNEELAEANEKLKDEIQKRYEVQISLEESENKFRSFIMQSTEGITLIDESGKFVEWNKAMESIFHVERNEVINTYAWEFDYRFLPEKRRTPEMFEELKNSILDYFSDLNRNKVLTFEGFYQTMEIKHKYLTITVFPVLTPKGKFVGRIVRDFTGIRRAQEEIQRKSEELRVINESLEEQKQQLEQTLYKLKKAQTQLVESEKMVSLGVLTAGVAHEINNPVNYINTGLEGLKMSLQDCMSVIKLYEEIDKKNVFQKLKEIENYKIEIEFKELQQSVDLLLKNMQTGVDRIAEIVKSLRTFARVEDNELKETHIHEIIDSVLVMLHNQYKNNIEIVKNYAKLPAIYCFPGRLSQVFMNIISNAIQAIPQKGTISIATAFNSKAKKISISIKDSGIGIPHDIIDKVFEPFFTTKEVGKGTGLGLSISYSIIQRHKGEIKISSEEGKGTEFTIILPVMPEI